LTGEHPEAGVQADRHRKQIGTAPQGSKDVGREYAPFRSCVQ
jgi:hypothetical protein